MVSFQQILLVSLQNLAHFDNSSLVDLISLLLFAVPKPIGFIFLVLFPHCFTDTRSNVAPLLHLKGFRSKKFRDNCAFSVSTVCQLNKKAKFYHFGLNKNHTSCSKLLYCVFFIGRNTFLELGGSNSPQALSTKVIVLFSTPCPLR